MGEFIGQTDANILRMILGLVGVASGAATFEITDNGLFTRVMDQAQVMLAEVGVTKKMFDLYKLEGNPEGKFEVGLDLSKMSAWTGRVEQGGEVVWKTNGEIHEVILVSKENIRKDRKLVMGVVRNLPYWYAPQIPNPLDCELKLKIDELLNILGDCAQAGDELMLTFDEKGVEFLTGKLSGDHIRDYVFYDSVLFSQDFQRKLNPELKQIQIFLSYLRTVIGSVSAFSEYVTLKFGAKTPILIQIPALEGTSLQTLNYYIAPIETEHEVEA